MQFCVHSTNPNNIMLQESNHMNTSSISVIGTGAWGTALAQITALKGLDVQLYARRTELADEINQTHTNTVHLPGIALNKRVTATTGLQKVLNSDIVLMVTPAQAMRTILEQMKPHIRPNHVLVLCSKGIEQDTLLLMSEVVEDIIPGTQTAILSGPNFAKDIAQTKPAATTLASISHPLSETLQNTIASENFRPYITTDIVGTQIAGAVKNVTAIGCGIAKGLDMGESARASLVTRGLAEITRLGVAMGARPETFLGLCGVGDMMLTCSSEQSRNFSLGLALAQGQTLEEIMHCRNTVSEGVHTAKSVVALAKKHNVDMPICETVNACVNENLPIKEAIKSMLSRPLGKEMR
jgi:glycerol-3-phosphate dehydrogenase (NAD(P)+)